jgi:hypothetical protein
LFLGIFAHSHGESKATIGHEKAAPESAVIKYSGRGANAPNPDPLAVGKRIAEGGSVVFAFWKQSRGLTVETQMCYMEDDGRQNEQDNHEESTTWKNIKLNGEIGQTEEVRSNMRVVVQTR